MIDWIRLSLPLRHTPIPAGRVLSTEADGTVSWECVKKVGVRGSFESNIQITSAGGDGKGRATELFMDGNFSKFLQGHNAFGSNDVCSLAAATFRRVVDLCPDFFAGADIGFAYQRAKRGDFLVKAVDINEMFQLPNDPSVEAWLHAAEMRACKRAGRAVRDKGTVYLGKSSRRWAFKFYNKLREVIARKGVPDPFADDLLPWLEGKLRAELRLLALELKTLGITHGRHLDPARIDELFRDYLGRIDMNAQVTLIDKEIFDLPRPVQATYQLWRQGASLRSLLPQNTFYRHRRLLRPFGIDINLPPADPDRSNVVPMLRVLEAQPVAVPDWAYRKGMVHR